jgi:iron-sulfur cluster assembly accessory protein
MSDCKDVKKVFVPAASESAAVAAPSPKGIEIRSRAAEKIKLFLSQEGKALDAYGLRISVKKDGCSGFSYDMALSDLATAKENGDKIFTFEDAHVIIEKTSYFYVLGSYLDYIEALTGSGFNLINPNVKKTCSCGSSFAV